MLFDSNKGWSWSDSPQQTQSEVKTYSADGIEAFRSDNWEKMTDDQKIESLQSLSDEYSAEIGLSDPPTVVPESNPQNYGGYVAGTNQLRINLDACSNPYEAIDTVAHEDNHAYQAESINSTLNGASKYSAGDQALIKAENGVGYRNSGAAYDLQTLELDSNNAGIKYVTSRCSGMADDPAYYDYMTSREAHFQRVNGGLSNTEAVNAQEAGQIRDSYNAGEITAEEAKLANETVAKGNVTFRDAAQESGQAAHQGCIDGSLAKAGQLHESFVQNQNGGTLDQNCVQAHEKCIGYLKEGRAQSEAELTSLKAEQSEYISSHNMGFREVAADETCRDYRSKIESCEQKIGQYKYSETALSTDNELVSSHSNGMDNSQSSSMQSGSEQHSESQSSGMEAGQSM